MTPTDPSTTGFDAGNDVRALLLVHDGIRASVPSAARRVRALQPGDRRAARALARWWEAFSRALHRHRSGEDEALWPLVLAAAPVLAGEAHRLACERPQLDADLALVAVGLDRLGRLAEPDFGAVRINLAATVTRLDIHLRRHLAAQEALVLPVLRHGVAPAGWADLEATLYAQPDRHELAVLPAPRCTPRGPRRSAPARALHDLVLGPRYRRPLRAPATR